MHDTGNYNIMTISLEGCKFNECGRDENLPGAGYRVLWLRGNNNCCPPASGIIAKKKAQLKSFM